MTIMFMAIQETLDDPEGMEPVRSALCKSDCVPELLLTFCFCLLVVLQLL